MYTLIFSKKALKSVTKFPVEEQSRIKQATKNLEENPFAFDLKKLHQPHFSSHRLRIGNYRIFLNIDTSQKAILIIEIRRRTSQTYR